MIRVYSRHVIVAWDFNIRLGRPDNFHTRQLLDEFTAYGLQCRVLSSTHDRGVILDVVATRDDIAAAPVVDVVDVGISDHRLLRWTSQLERPTPVYHTSTFVRPRHQTEIVNGAHGREPRPI